MNRIYPWLSIIVVGLFGGSLAAQNEPYYQLPGNRVEKEFRTFPNLEANLTKVYLRAEGSVFTNGNLLDNNINGDLTTRQEPDFNWGISLGYNYLDKWMVDVGYLNNPLLMTNILLVEPYSITNGAAYELHTIPVRFQHSVWTLDRVTKSTRLFVGGALLFNTNGKATELSNERQRFLRPNRHTSPDTVLLSYRSVLNNVPVQTELFVELRGKLAEVMDIGVYAKMQNSFSHPLEMSIFRQINDNPGESATQVLSSLRMRYGLVIHYNFAVITRYKSKIR